MPHRLAFWRADPSTSVESGSPDEGDAIAVVTLERDDAEEVQAEGDDGEAVRAAGPAVADTPTEASGRVDNAGEFVHELPTQAPIIGNVRALAAPHVAPSQRWRTPSVVLDGARVGAFDVAGASMIGSSHAQGGSVRQDAYDFVLAASGELVLAIADGMGSRHCSQVGARLFCEGVVLAASGPGPVPTVEELTLAGQEHAARLAAAYELPEREIGFVAGVAVVTEGSAVIARVGDVSAFAMGEELVELFGADDGPVNAVSASLPDPSAPIETATTKLPVLALVTDGLAADLRNSLQARTWLSEQWRSSRGAHAFGDSLRYRRQGSHDDRTALVAWRRLPDDLVTGGGDGSAMGR